MPPAPTSCRFGGRLIQALAHAAGDGPALRVSGAPPETGYRVSRGGTTLASGLSSASGEISVPAFACGALPGAGGTLHLYGSPTYVRSGERASGTVVFDRSTGRWWNWTTASGTACTSFTRTQRCR